MGFGVFEKFVDASPLQTEVRVIIDEISMVRADIIDAVDRILRVYSRNLREHIAHQ